MKKKKTLNCKYLRLPKLQIAIITFLNINYNHGFWSLLFKIQIIITYEFQVGIPVIGFSPIMNTPVLLHAHDEFLNKEVFLKGIKIYENVIKGIANV